MIEEIRKGRTAEAAECWADGLCTGAWDPGEDAEVALREAWVAATVEDCNRLKRPLEATACEAMTSAKEASTIAAVTTV